MEWLNGWRKFLHGCSQMGGQMKKIFARIHVCRKFLHGCNQTDTCLMKIFERILWLNEWTANKNFWTDKVEQINNWRKYFLKDEQLKKIILFLNGCGWSVRRPKKIILITILKQVPQLCERMQIFFAWIAWGVWMDANFFCRDSLSCSNRCPIHSNS